MSAAEMHPATAAAAHSGVGAGPVTPDAAGAGAGAVRPGFTPARLPLGQMIAVIVASCVAGAGGVIGLRLIRAGADVPVTLQSAALGVLGVLVAGLLAIFAFRQLASGGASGLPAAVMGCAMIRLLGSVALALGIYQLSGPEKLTFWYAFLAAGVLALVLETRLLHRWLAREAPRS